MVKIYLFILFAGLFLITNLYENYCRERERNTIATNASRQYAETMGRLWHWFQWINWFFVFVFTTYLIFDLTWLAGAIVFVIGASWWILFDGSLNRLRGEKFFYRSQFSTSEFEHYAYPKTKIVLLIISIILFVIAL
mgnify:CR=1 FL=1